MNRAMPLVVGSDDCIRLLFRGIFVAYELLRRGDKLRLLCRAAGGTQRQQRRQQGAATTATAITAAVSFCTRVSRKERREQRRLQGRDERARHRRRNGDRDRNGGKQQAHRQAQGDAGEHDGEDVAALPAGGEQQGRGEQLGQPPTRSASATPISAACVIRSAVCSSPENSVSGKSAPMIPMPSPPSSPRKHDVPLHRLEKALQAPERPHEQQADRTADQAEGRGVKQVHERGA